MGVKERVMQFIDSQNLSVSEFERRGNLSNGYVKNFKGSFGEGKLNDVLKAFPSLNKVWLLTGEGNMLLDGSVEIGKDGEKIYKLPLLPVDAMAGLPMGDINTVTLAQCEQYVVPEFIYYGAQMLIRVSGDSMIPRYKHGDIVAIRELRAFTFFQWGRVYVLDTDQGALLKRLFEFKLEPEKYVICRSDNSKNYPDIRMPIRSIRGFYLVVGVISIE